MNLRLILAVFLPLLLAVPTDGFNNPSDEVRRYVEGQVIVKFRATAGPAAVSSVSQALNARTISRLKTMPVELWEISGKTVEEALELFENDPRVEYISPNGYIYLDSRFPNDPRFHELWGLHNNSENGGVLDADADAPGAWGIETGKDVLVAVIDTGIDLLHVDLAPNIYTNPGEIPGNGIDDDNNGYVDDVHGWDFAEDDNDPSDATGHGTHVSGTIAAVGNNGVGVTGVNWSAKILPVKIFPAESIVGMMWNGVQGIEYATMMGARVQNCSWSYPVLEGYWPPYFRDAVETALYAGFFIVTSAGNEEGRDLEKNPVLPNCWPHDNIITVASTTRSDEMARYSSFGRLSVDLGAPGSAVLSCIPGDIYREYSGTSMASPHVAGAISLIWSKAPSLSLLEVREILLASVDPLPSLQGITVTGGRLNIHKALALLDEVAPAPVTDLTATAVDPKSISLAWTASGDDGAAGTARKYDLRYDTSPIDSANFLSAPLVYNPPVPQPAGAVEAFTVSGLDPNTTYYFALEVIDETNNSSPVSNVVSATTPAPDPPPQISVLPSSLVKTLVTGGRAEKQVTIENTGAGDLEWRVEIDDGSFVPGRVSAGGDLDPGKAPGVIAPPVTYTVHGNGPSRAPGILAGVTILFDVSHGQIQDSRNTIISDLTSRGADVVLNNAPLTPDRLASADILWLTDVEVYTSWSDPELSALYGWIWSGGGLLLEGDDEPAVDSFNRILSGLDAGIGYAVEPGASGASTNIFPHETTRDVGSILLDRNISRLASVTPPAKLLFEDHQNEAAAACRTVGSGRIVAIADEVFEDARMGSNDNRLFGNQVFDWLAGNYWLLAAPRSGTLSPGNNQVLTLTFDAAALEGGLYSSDVIVRNTDPSDPRVGVNVTMGVTAIADIELSKESFDFGVVYRGVSYGDTLCIYNNGADNLIISSVETTNGDFSVDVGVLTLPPREGRNVVIQCSPTGLGTIAGKLVITSNDPDEAVYEIQLEASGYDPPIIHVAPDSLYEGLFTDELVTRTVTVDNPGASDLVVQISVEVPRDAVESVTFSSRARGVTTYPPGSSESRLPDEGEITRGLPTGDAYSVIQGAEPAGGSSPLFSADFEDGDYDGWRDAGSGINEVTDATAAIFTKYSYHEYNSSQGHSNGVLRNLPDDVKPRYVSYHVRPGRTDFADGYFTLLEKSGRLIWWSIFTSRGLIYVNRDPDWVWAVPYQANRWYWFELKNIDYEAQTLDYYLDRSLIAANVPFCDQTSGAGVRVVELYSYHAEQQAWWDEIVFSDEDTNAWLKIDPVSFTVPAGGSADLTLTIDARLERRGDRELTLSLTSNDPFRPVVEVPVCLSATAVPRIVLSESQLDFGQITITVPESSVLSIHNAGFDSSLVVTNISGPDFISVNPDSFVLESRSIRDLTVTLKPTVPGPVGGTISIESNDRLNGFISVPFTASAVLPPELAVAPDTLAYVLDAGEVTHDHIAVGNPAAPGALDLEYKATVDGQLVPWLFLDNPGGVTGILPPGSVDTLGLTVDTGELTAGVHTQSVLVRNLFPPKLTARVFVTCVVRGTPSISVADTIVDFGTLFTGQTEKRFLEVSNTGTDTLVVGDVSVDTAGFQVTPASFAVSPRAAETVEILCSPQSAGSISATLSISSNDTNRSVVAVPVVAQVVDGPRITADPDSISLSIREGSTASRSILLANTGASDLEWVVDLNFISPAEILGVGSSPSARVEERVDGLMDVLWYGDHGAMGISYWSTIITDLERRGGTVTQESGLISRELLAPYDVLWLGDTDAALGPGELDAIVEWLSEGGGLLIEADNAGSIQTYNALLNQAGSGVTIAGWNVVGGPASIITPHETTFGVGSVFFMNPTAYLTAVPAPANSLVKNINSLTVAAQNTIGKGRLVVLTDQVFMDLVIGIGDTRTFANQVFGWLAGVNWFSVKPVAGRNPPDTGTALDLRFDTSRLVPDVYRINMEINSNDPFKPTIQVPVRLIVDASVPRTFDLALEEGLNLRSWNVEAAADSTSALIAPVAAHVVSIQGFDQGGLVYDPSVPPGYNTLLTMDHLHGYWIRATDDVTWTINGFQINHRIPIDLDPGYNLVSYLPGFEDSTAHAIETILDKTSVVLGYDGGGLIYDPDIPPEFNSLPTMKPGFGYWIKLTEAGALIYPLAPAAAGENTPVATAAASAVSDHEVRTVPTREWIGVWGEDIRFDGTTVAPGTPVTALDASGVVCGECEVGPGGKIGMMSVYRDDADTENDEGADPGEVIKIVVGDAGILSGIRWTHVGDVVCLNSDAVIVQPAAEQLPGRSALYQNAPNPFNPSTTIRYDLAKPAGVKLSVYNIRGELVRTVVNRRQAAGRHAVEWNGRNDAGKPVASGVYFFRLEAGEYVETKKMLLLK